VRETLTYCNGPVATESEPFRGLSGNKVAFPFAAIELIEDMIPFHTCKNNNASLTVRRSNSPRSCALVVLCSTVRKTFFSCGRKLDCVTIHVVTVRL
jgi:hypothetical protein